jgi:biofilm PGA synthesis N-glycosyltransferase PgaC
MEDALRGYFLETTDALNNIIIIYASFIYISYITLTILSGLAVRRYKRKNSFVDYNILLSTDFTPSVSLIAPAYNESVIIVESLKSLLSLHYNNCEVILVNDGSTDDTLEQLIREYDLEKVDISYEKRVNSKKIRGIYKAKNPAYNKLVVVDKENGGKSDALNAGINVSGNTLIACIDVDCILEPDSLLKLVKPFMEEKKKVIAAGGVIRIVNSCEVKDGHMVKVNVPDNFLARVQVLEYFRAFLTGRMAWSSMDGLVLISGALGMFDKETVLRAGGYNTKTVGEDIELLVRMRRVMYEEKKPCKVVFVPDPLCWTEAPENLKMLVNQRNRWTRGTIETLILHRKMILNPRYGIHGMLSLPFWIVLEWLAPLLEFLGISALIIMAVMGFVDWIYILTVFGFVYSFTVMYSVFAILFEERSYQQYKHPKHLLKLVVAALLEPLFYHPINIWAAIKGHYDLFTGKKSWGRMVRTGYSEVPKKKKAAKVEVVNS